jgi:hypothetical protein
VGKLKGDHCLNYKELAHVANKLRVHPSGNSKDIVVRLCVFLNKPKCTLFDKEATTIGRKAQVTLLNTLTDIEISHIFKQAGYKEQGTRSYRLKRIHSFLTFYSPQLDGILESTHTTTTSTVPPSLDLIVSPRGGGHSSKTSRPRGLKVMSLMKRGIAMTRKHNADIELNCVTGYTLSTPTPPTQRQAVLRPRPPHVKPTQPVTSGIANTSVTRTTPTTSSSSSSLNSTKIPLDFVSDADAEESKAMDRAGVVFFDNLVLFTREELRQACWRLQLVPIGQTTATKCEMMKLIHSYTQAAENQA